MVQPVQRYELNIVPPVIYIHGSVVTIPRTVFVFQIARPPALAKSRSDIMTQLELAVKRSTNQKAKAKKMWNKVGSNG